MVDRRGLAATMLAGLLFGTSVPVIKLGLNFVPPNTFVTLRFLFASALIVFLLQGRGWVQRDLFRSRKIWIIGFINAFGYVLQFQGQLITSSSNAALIISTAALMIPVLSLAYVHEKLGMRKITGVLLGFIGITLLVTRGQAVNLGSSELLGDFLILGTAVTIALVFVLSKDLVEKKGGRPVTGGIILVTAMLLLPTVPFDLRTSISLALILFYVAFLAVFATVGAYYFFMKGLESVSPTISSIILPIEVVVAVTLSAIIFGDPFNLYSGTGAFLIIVGVVLVSSAA
ncbi:MAG TPA: DMT family transporter [Candidatus Limnocylindrales bacterium]|nr:DMT family transporter [Candidatus Limnocylindrales bacterium]